MLIHNILWGVIILILIIWLFGLLFRLAGGIIRILLIIAGIIIVVNLLGYIFIR